MENSKEKADRVVPSPASEKELGTIIIKPTLKRYFIMIMYGFCAMEKSFQWINLSTITNKVALYYGIDNIAVNWTSVLFMVTFIPLVLPTGWLIERIGLRKAVLIGSSGTTLGACIKCFSCYEDGFHIVMIGQLIVSLSEQFIFCIPARVASVWFPDEQVSLATGFGIFGNQCGIALAFLVPQAFLQGLETRQEIGQGLYRLFVWTAILCLTTFIVLVFLFDDKPKYAPGAARFKKILEEHEQRSKIASPREEFKLFWSHLSQILCESSSLFLVVSYGIIVGTLYAIQTCLNQMIAVGNDGDEVGGWSNANEIVSRAGLSIVLAGMFGALFWGHLCDKTHKYILINRLLCLGSIVSVFAFALALEQVNQALYLYAASALMGFMTIGYTVVGVDTIVEITYPIPEMIVLGVISLSPQVFGIVITFLCSAIADVYKSDYANAFLITCLSLGLVFTLLIKERLKRQNVVEATKRLHLEQKNQQQMLSI